MPFDLHPRLRTPAATLAGAVLLAGTLAACGSGGPSRAQTLEVWTYQDASTHIQAEAVERFNETSDVQLELVEIPGANYQERMRTAMGTPNAPDIFFNWGSGSISDFVQQDMLVDLTDTLAETEELRDAFVPTVLAAAEVDGGVYGVPMRGVQPVILFYNTELFEQVGAEPPTTWEEMTELIEVFQEEDITPVALGGADAWTSLMWLEYLLDRIGGPEVWQRIETGEAEAWGDPAVEAAAQTALDLIDDGAFGSTFLSNAYTNDGVSTYFAQGRAAMHLMGSWEYGSQLANAEEFARERLGYSTFPVFSDGAGDASAIVGNPNNYWSVNSELEGERLDAALEFLKHTTDDDYLSALVTNGDIPGTAGVDDRLDDHPDPEFARFQYDLITEASAFTQSWDQALPNRAATEMMNAVDDLFSGGLTAQEFADTLRGVS
ncbi:ABC transporter substrate-binding protein [Streptomyces bohaiensis]|uniref:Extracellular solute-binding protein n=1 Tax=Streptomyces bohaiensis TaxID=1431344 RepID=A0ABX1CGJ8_9ACTN|nr:extracellular solute-binding protein [Streptomyces bohaiensis]NJQ16282.1 extracellular solute-binding protein [Streptomyces bohaiensis]